MYNLGVRDFFSKKYSTALCSCSSVNQTAPIPKRYYGGAVDPCLQFFRDKFVDTRTRVTEQLKRRVHHSIVNIYYFILK